MGQRGVRELIILAPNLVQQRPQKGRFAPFQTERSKIKDSPS